MSIPNSKRTSFPSLFKGIVTTTFAMMLLALIGVPFRVQEGNTTSIEPSSIITKTTKTASAANNGSLKIAFGGNSILYFNDCPGLVVAMMKSTGYQVTYDACLRGGASLATLWTQGCSNEFSTTATAATNTEIRMTMSKLLRSESWDYIVLNDQTRSPALADKQRLAMYYLNKTYATLFYKTGATPIFLQTAAYREPLTVEGIGDFDEFTDALTRGYQAYADLLTNSFLQQQQQQQAQTQTQTQTQTQQQQTQTVTKHGPNHAQVAPVGQAYAHVRNAHPELWERLYVEDGVHPSPLGTWLQACVLYATILGKDPPAQQHDNLDLFWNDPVSGRRRTYLPLPSKEEAEELRRVAIQITGVAGTVP